MITDEEFFLEKIEQGSNIVLTDIDRSILLTSVHEEINYDQLNVSVARLPQLNEIGIKGLTSAYKQDTVGRNKDAGLVWDKHNVSIYKNSQCLISGIVQNWYLTEGRPLEKKLFRWF